MNSKNTNIFHLADIQNFEERNLANAKIRNLESISKTLRYIAKLVYQTGRGAKGMASEILINKRLSSYPVIQDKLSEAIRKALDSPKDFGILCNMAANDIDIRVADLVEQREEFIFGGGKTKKGIVDDE